ncbi:MAG: tyrosine-type recombinase/integrase [Planctomycetaceae bacterium]
MGRKPSSIPAYLLHKPTGQARCRIDGKDHYLGLFGSDESRVRYGQLIAQLAGGVPVDPMARSKRSGGATDDPDADPGPTVGELCLAFMRYAESHYVKNGEMTSQVDAVRSTIRVLNSVYGLTPAKDFGPLALKAVRQQMIEKGWVRDTVNAAVGRVRRIFKHAVSHELIDPGLLQRLQAVPPLLAGRTEAPDLPPRTAVPDLSIAVVKVRVSDLVGDLIDLQRLTGARSGELLGLTARNIDRAGDVWSAKLTDHKNAHHGQSRTLHFGPQCQLILRRYLSTKSDAPLFPITRHAYCRAITRACDSAGIERWVPHQLRHTTANVVRQQFGLEHTQSVLGHSKADMTEHYATAGTERAIEVARRIG